MTRPDVWKFNQKKYGNTTPMKVLSEKSPEKLHDEHGVSIDEDSIEPLFSAETVVATAAGMTQPRNFHAFEEEQREAVRDFLEALWRELGYQTEEVEE